MRSSSGDPPAHTTAQGTFPLPLPRLPQALGNTMLFFDSQREGYLPLSTSAAVPWRGPAFTADYNTTVTLASSLPNSTLDGFGVRGSGGGVRQNGLKQHA